MSENTFPLLANVIKQVAMQAWMAFLLVDEDDAKRWLSLFLAAILTILRTR